MSSSASMDAPGAGLTDIGDLSIATLAFWIPAFFLAVYCCIRQGFNRQSGWLFILLLAVCRIIGNACTVYYEEKSGASSSLQTASAITGSIGISFLLSAVTGLMIRVYEHMSRERIVKARFMKLIYLVITVAIVLSIVGGIKAEGNITEPNSSTYKLGFKLLKAALVLLLIVFVVVCALILLSLLNLRYVLDGERKLVYAATAAMPFVFVRILYALIAVFKNSGDFQLFAPYVWTEAFMATLEEFMVGIIIIAVGLIAAPPNKAGNYPKDAEVQQPYPQQYPQYPQQGYPQRG